MTYIDILLIVLLSTTLFYCRLLIIRLNTIQINNAKFELVNKELLKSTNIIENNIKNLKHASEHAQNQINSAILDAQAVVQKLVKTDVTNSEKNVYQELKNFDNDSVKASQMESKNEKHNEISAILARFDAKINKPQ